MNGLLGARALPETKREKRRMPSANGRRNNV